MFSAFILYIIVFIEKCARKEILSKNWFWPPFFKYGGASGKDTRSQIEIQKEHIEIYKMSPISKLPENFPGKTTKWLDYIYIFKNGTSYDRNRRSREPLNRFTNQDICWKGLLSLIISNEKDLQNFAKILFFQKMWQAKRARVQLVII